MTAVEWFELELKHKLGEIVINQNWQLLENIIKQAVEMEKEQIIYARTTAPILPSIDKADYFIEALNYYNETFKSE